MVVRHHYAGLRRMHVKAARAHLSAHLKYIEHRSRDQERESRDDRRIFNKHSDVINRKDAMRDVTEHASQRDAYYHKMMLSPGPDIPVEDYRQWTRAIMHDLEQRQGKKLHWYAVQHHNTEHAHVHIVIAGAGERFDTGQQEAVFIRPNDYTFLKERGKEHSELAHQQLIQETLQEIDRLDDTVTSHQDLVLSEGIER
jgi:type IV secretory pathway VirD2 relaxase